MANEEYHAQSSDEIVERMLAQARAEDRAPQALRERIEADRHRAHRARGSRRGWATRPLAPAVVGLVALAVVIALVLPSGTPGGPSVSQAAAIALRGPVNPPPGPEGADPRRWLAANVGETYFPNWGSAFGWRPVGQRRDRLGGRNAITIYYRSAGKTIAYTIVGGDPLREPGGERSRRGTYVLDSLVLHGRRVVTWRRSGHTCVVSARGVDLGELQRLAAWG